MGRHPRPHVAAGRNKYRRIQRRRSWIYRAAFLHVRRLCSRGFYGSWQMVGPAIWRSRTRRANQALRRALDVQSLLDPHGRRSL
jgi:hypothetical protein